MREGWCLNEYKLDPKELAEGADPKLMNRRNRWCERRATTTRPPPRYPNAKPRDLCGWCAETWDAEASFVEWAGK